MSKPFAEVGEVLIPVQQDQGSRRMLVLGSSMAELADPLVADSRGRPGQESRDLRACGCRRLRVGGNTMTCDDGPSGMADQGGTDSAMPPMGTLVIRTWCEPDQVPSFRARITYSQEPDDPNTVAAADPDEALSVVRQWLFAQPGSPDEV